jgi:hypothetical protein
LRRRLTLVLLAACLAGGVWVAILLVDRDGDDPVAGEEVGLEPIGTAPSPGDEVLAEGSRWTLLVTPQQELELRRPNAVSGASAWTRPLTLNEASAFKVARGGEAVTLVAGPVHEDAAEVVVETLEGAAAEATVLSAHELQWFFAEMRGTVRVSAITARDANGQVVDEYTLPPMPPDPSIAAPRAQGKAVKEFPPKPPE